MRKATLLLAAALAACSAPAPKSSAPASSLPSAAPIIFPIARGALPPNEELMPGARREYRGGTHEGVDLYERANGDGIACGEPVVSATDGWIIRADVEWHAMSLREYQSLTASLKKERNEDMLDRLRGRQIWVKLADGTVLHYCHLNSVANGITPGTMLNPGTTIGAVGNSGTEDGARSTGKNCHLHFEVRMPGGEYLGQGRSPAEIRALWQKLFGVVAPVK